MFLVHCKSFFYSVFGDKGLQVNNDQRPTVLHKYEDSNQQGGHLTGSEDVMKAPFVICIDSNNDYMFQHFVTVNHKLLKKEDLRKIALLCYPFKDMAAVDNYKMKREKGIIKENNGGYLNEGTQGFEEYLIKDTEEENHAVDNVIPRKAEKLGINVSGNGEMFDNSSLSRQRRSLNGFIYYTHRLSKIMNVVDLKRLLFGKLQSQGVRPRLRKPRFHFITSKVPQADILDPIASHLIR